MSELDVNALAASLADTASSLERHINRRAQEIAEPQVIAAQQHAATRIENIGRDIKFERQRNGDLIAELRRQLNAQVKQNERLGREAKAAKAAIRGVELLKVWTNEDRQKFVFAEELWAALAEVSNYGPAALLAATTTNEGDRS